MRDTDCGHQASLSTSAGYVRLGLSHCLSAACISHHRGCTLLFSLSCLWFRLRYWCWPLCRSCKGGLHRDGVRHCPFSLCVGGVLKLSLRTSSLSIFVRVCIAGRFTTVGKCICWLGFFIYRPHCSQNSSIGQLYVFRVCCLGLSDQSSLRRRPWLERQPPA